jgi:hypothetical protein
VENKIVTGCNDCPLHYMYDDFYISICTHPKGQSGDIEPSNDRTDLHERLPKTPDWCPLKQESLTLQYAEVKKGTS